MRHKAITLAAIWLLTYAAAAPLLAADMDAPVVSLERVQASAALQYDAVRPGAESYIAVTFLLEEGWHAYADAATAAGGMNLKLAAAADGVRFGTPVFPMPHDYFDPSAEKHVKVYSGRFTVYLPFVVGQPPADKAKIPIAVIFSGAICSDQLCTIKNGTMGLHVLVTPDAPMDTPAFVLPEVETPEAAEGVMGTSVFVSLLLAVLAGLILNIMPCVWPVLPIVIMRMLDQAGRSRGRSILFGIAFSLGILLFFLAFAVVNIVLRMSVGAAFNFADLSQNAGYLTFMSLLLVVLALFMFGVFNIGIPSSLTGKASSGSGIIGSIGTGFLAAILATPCSFGILVAVLVWAQSQPIPLATLTIMLIGVGMALPYLVLTAIPGLLTRMPRPGKWMDIFKQAVGFILLVIAVKMMVGLPAERLVSLLYYTPILAFAVWMWGGWVDYSTPALRKWTVRLVAVILAVLCGYYFLHVQSPEEQLIQWQPYDAQKIDDALKTGRPVLIDFTAAWCFNCSVLEKVVHTRQDIADLVKEKNVLPIKADVTLADYPAAVALKNVYHESAIPLHVLLVPGNPEPVKFRGVFIGSDLKKALEGLPQPVTEKTSEQVETAS